MFPGDSLPFDSSDVMLLMGKTPAYLGLLQTCRHIHHEVAGLLFNTVEMDLRGEISPEKALQQIGLRHVRYIKHITIQFQEYLEEKDVTFNVIRIATLGSWRVAAILRLLQRAGATLHTVTLKAPWHRRGCSDSGDLAHIACINMEPLLRDASIFSNVQTVLFPEYVALCPPRNRCHLRPVRNRPLTDVQKEEIIKRLHFQAEGATAVTSFGQRTAAPFPKGFFVIENPRVSFGSEDTLPPPCEVEWRDMFQEQMAQLKSFGLSAHRCRGR